MLSLNMTNQGTYWRAFQFARQLVLRNHDVILVTTSRTHKSGISEKTIEGFRLIESPDLFTGSLRSGWDPWNTINRIVRLYREKFDLIHAFEARPTVVYPALIKHRQNIPLIMDWADWFGKGGSVEERSNQIIRTVLRPVETYFEEHFRPIADGNTVICSTLFNKALNLQIPEDRLCLLWNGADTERIKPYPKEPTRKELSLPENTPIVGYLGTIFHRDAVLLAQAYNLVLKQFPEARLCIIGNCPYDIRPMVIKPESVLQTGLITDEGINQYLCACDQLWLPVYDSPANRGRLPYKLADYLAAGRPVIATAVGDIPVIIDRKIGDITRDDPCEFAQKSIGLLQSPERAEKMGFQARQYAETKMTWSVLTDRLIDFYRTIIGN